MYLLKKIVGKNTFQKSLACLKTRGMMVSFGNASGPLDPVNVPKDIEDYQLKKVNETKLNNFSEKYRLNI